MLSLIEVLFCNCNTRPLHWSWSLVVQAWNKVCTLEKKRMYLVERVWCAVQITSSSETEAITRQQLVKGHAYSVTAAEEVRQAAGIGRTWPKVLLQATLQRRLGKRVTLSALLLWLLVTEVPFDGLSTAISDLKKWSEWAGLAEVSVYSWARSHRLGSVFFFL